VGRRAGWGGCPSGILQRTPKRGSPTGRGKSGENSFRRRSVKKLLPPLKLLSLLPLQHRISPGSRISLGRGSKGEVGGGGGGVWICSLPEPRLSRRRTSTWPGEKPKKPMKSPKPKSSGKWDPMKNLEIHRNDSKEMNRGDSHFMQKEIPMQRGGVQRNLEKKRRGEQKNRTAKQNHPRRKRSKKEGDQSK